MEVPASLRRWFVVHFAVDLAFAVPLLVAPVATLHAFGWSVVDPVATRLVAAALVGIGGQSLLGFREGPDVFRAMLNLKLLWSGTAILGLAIGLATGAPPMTALFLALFLGFAGVWGWYRARIASPARARAIP